MAFLDNVKQPKFWKMFINFAIPFFLFVIIFSLFINSSSSIFSGEFSEVFKQNFTEGKWKVFFAPKLFLSTLYGLYMANKNIKSLYKKNK
ncbi:MAG: hypothetical protein HWD82_04850 [Flavobacteriaceae bacterium]|nr:hypothetical protein [Flavobacteriaceae bacterium]